MAQGFTRFTAPLAMASILAMAAHMPRTATAQVQDLCGNWAGRWHSCTSGHKGRLSATFCKINESQVSATFRGTFFKVVPFRYKAVLTIVHLEPGLMRLAGSQRLGPLMGAFQYQATVTGDQFTATYRSKKDRGTWTMTRCR